MAEIITIDEGRHNSALSAAIQRLNESGQWKKQRIVQLIPGGKSLHPKAYVSHRGLIVPPNQAFVPIYIQDAEVGHAYDEGFSYVLDHPELGTWEYILTIEHDNIPLADGLVRLIRAMEAHPEFACVGGLYWTKGEGGVPQIWGNIEDPIINFRPQRPEPGKVLECYGTGMGFNLWRIPFLRELKRKGMARPWFKTTAGIEGSGTQDLYFAQKARQYGFRCAVDCDVLVGHLDTSTGVVW